MPARLILKERESKPLIDELRKISGYEQLPHKSRIEVQAARKLEVIFMDGRPVAVRKDTEMVPTLVNTEALTSMPKVLVDMGAVSHVTSGADVMAPGIRRVDGVFSAGQLLVVLDERFGKFLAVGRALLDSTGFSRTGKGKVIQNLHYVGDAAWEVIKPFSRPASNSS